MNLRPPRLTITNQHSKAELEMSEREIPQGHPGSLCPFCDNEVEAWMPWDTVTANGSRYLCHVECLRDEEEDD